MRLSITARLTITFGVLTALVLVPAALFLYHSVASGIRAESERNAEATAANLAFIGRYQWDEDLLVEYNKDGVALLETLNLSAPDWAVIRGDGTVVRSRGIFDALKVSRQPDGASLVRIEGAPYRVAAVPLLAASESFHNLPEAVRTGVLEASPDGMFLRARWESARYKKDPRKGTAVVEVSMLEPALVLRLTLTSEGEVTRRAKEFLDEWAGAPPDSHGGFDELPEAVRPAVRRESVGGAYSFLGATWERGPGEGVDSVEIALLQPAHLHELKLTPDGKVHQSDREKPDRRVPRDLVARLGLQVDPEAVSFGPWKAYGGLLIAVLRGTTSEGDFKVAVNRLGERFILDGDGNVVGPDPDSRLWMFAATDATPEVARTEELRLTIGAGLPLLWAAIVFIGWYVTRRALSPVKSIVDTVERIELSRLDERLAVGEAEDELSSISATVNRMLDRIEEGYGRERQFTGDASHELRGPLAKVIADIDLALSQDRSSGEYRDTLMRCRRYAERMQHLVESLLWLARLDSRGAAVSSRAFDLTDLLTEVVRAFPPEEASRVQLDIDAERPAVSALGDPDLIRVMIRNLVQNALRYSSPRDPVAIHLASTGSLATVEVQDHGEGIAEEELPRVFARFYRIDKSRSRETGGSGLGLAIVDEIAQAHGFRVSLRNAEDGGLVASFSLPTDPTSRAGSRAGRS